MHNDYYTIINVNGDIIIFCITQYYQQENNCI